MLCPQCRRMVGKDGYCPMGHLARPELQVEKERVWAPPAGPPPLVPAEQPPPARAEPPPARDPYTPPGLGPSNPPPQPTTAAPSGDTVAPPSGVTWTTPPPSVPGEPPALPVETKRKGKTVFGVIAALLGVVLLGVFFLGRTAGAANLKYVFTAGETHRYQMSMSMDVSGGNLLGGGRFNGTVEMVMRQRVTKINKAGVATIEFAIERLSMTEGGKRRSVPLPSDVIVIEMTPDGRVLSTSGAEFLGDINPAAGLFGPESFSPILPRHKVDPGDKWSIGGDVPNPFGKSFHIDGTAELQERSGEGDQAAAVIKSVIASPLNFRIEFAKIAEAEGEALPEGFPSNAVMTFDGNLSMNLMQSMATKSGFLKSAIGDMKMTGTFGIENVPQIGNVSGVLNMSVQLTLTALS